MRDIALFHHDTMDGSGYPEGLSGNEISIEARIVAVADIFDAFTRRRPCKPGWSDADAFNLRRQTRRILRRRLD